MSDKQTSEQIVESVMSTVADYPDPGELDDNDIITVKINMYREGKDIKFALGSNRPVIDQGGRELFDFLQAEAKPVVDQRKATEGMGVTIGSLLVRGDGDIAGLEIEDEYKKPSKR